MERLNPDEFANKVINQFSSEITDLVFQYIENDEKLMLQYLRVISDYKLDKVNQTLGSSIKQRFNLDNDGRESNPKSKLIKSYTVHNTRTE